MLVASAVELVLQMIGAVAIGLAGGVIAGLLGVGGGVLFVPGLVIFLGLDQHHAEATSLLAIVPVAIVGTYTQDRYGNVRRADALLLGAAVAGRRRGRRGARQRPLGHGAARRVRRPDGARRRRSSCAGRSRRAAGARRERPEPTAPDRDRASVAPSADPLDCSGEWDSTIQFTSPFWL